jgi:hypothetical protein
LRYCQQKTHCRGIAVDRDEDGMRNDTLGFDFVQGDINSDSVRATVLNIGPPDTVFLFNILLHQLSWQHTLEQWSQAECICVFGPRWDGDNSVRLLDYGKEWFDEHVLRKLVGANYEATKRLLDSEQAYQRIELWQWGITGQDLSEHLQSLGYEVAAQVLFGPHDLEGFNVQGHIAFKSKSRV